MHELRGYAEPNFQEQLKHLSPCDFVIVEGYKNESIPKLEVHRRETGMPMLHPSDPHVMAIASDETLETKLPQFGLDDVEGIAQFVMQRMGFNRARLVR